MFDLWHAHRKLKKLGKTFDPLIAQAKKEGDEEKYEGLISELLMERDFIDIDSLISRRIIRRANGLDLPIPPYSDKEAWERNRATGAYYLTAKGRADLRSLSRKEKRERFEYWARWIVLLTGLIGAATGLVAVLFSLWK